MKKIVKISVGLKKNGRITQARINLSQDIIELLNITNEDRAIMIEYQNKIIKIQKATISSDTNTEEEIIKKGEDLIYFKTIKNLMVEKSGKNLKYTSYKLAIPINIIDDLKINKSDNEVEIEIIKPKKVIKIKKIGDDSMVEETSKGLVIDVKIEKGGTGKTFVSAQIAFRLASLDKKVLAITSDPQNNLIQHLTPKIKGFKDWKRLLNEADGLEKWVLKGEGDLVKIRNIDFIPIKGSNFSWQFIKKFPKFIDDMKRKYDYIIIDSTPIPSLDKVFVESSDKIIIPVFPDETTVQGAIGIIKEAGVEKILAIILNRYSNKKIQNKYKEEIEQAIEGTDILYSVIGDLSEIQYMIDMGKSLWEYKSKYINTIKDEFDKIVNEIINPGSTQKNNVSFDDFDNFDEF